MRPASLNGAIAGRKVHGRFRPRTIVEPVGTNVSTTRSGSVADAVLARTAPLRRLASAAVGVEKPGEPRVGRIVEAQLPTPGTGHDGCRQPGIRAEDRVV